MTTLNSMNRGTFSIDMLRDDVRVIERRGGDADAMKKAFAKMHRILKKMPVSTVDTLADLKKTRESRGRA